MLRRYASLALLVLFAWGGASACSSEGDQTAPETNGGAVAPGTPPLEGDVWAELRARPLQLPIVHDKRSCPFSAARALPSVPGHPGLGNGPLYSVFRGIPRIVDVFDPSRETSEGSPAETDWREATMLWVSTPEYRGPVLVRGKQLDGPNRLGFGPGVLPRWELGLTAGDWQRETEELRVWGRTARPPEGWRMLAVSLRIRAEGCYGFQVDTETSTQTIVFGAIVQM
jgi:hypothetical protein